MHFNKSISLSGSNNAEVWERSPQPPKANGGSGAEALGAAAILQPFSYKIRILGKFWPKFLLKNTYFKCLNKVCVLRPGAHAPQWRIKGGQMGARAQGSRSWGRINTLFQASKKCFKQKFIPK